MKSRFKNNAKARQGSGPAPDRGPTVELSDFCLVFQPGTAHLTARVRGSFAKIAGLSWASDAELDAKIRAACAEFESGNLLQRADGCFEIEVVDRTWLITPDYLKLVGVKTSHRDGGHVHRENSRAPDSPLPE